MTERFGPNPSQSKADQNLLLDSAASKIDASLSQKPDDVALVSSQSTSPPSMGSAIHTLRPGEDLYDLVDQTSGVVLLDFYADWCGPCKKQSKVLHDVEEMASDANARIIKINVDEHRDLAKKYKVSTLPTLLVMKDGHLSHKSTGYTRRGKIEDMLTK